MSRGAAAVAAAHREEDRPLPQKLKKIGYAALPLAHLAKVSCRLTTPARDILEWVFKHSTGIGPRRNEWVPLNLDRIASDTANSKNTVCTHLQLLGVTPDRRRASEKAKGDEKAKLLNGWTELLEMRRVGRQIEGKIDYDAYERLERLIDEHRGEGEDPVKVMVKRFVRTAVDVNFGKRPELVRTETAVPVGGYSYRGKPVAADSMSIRRDPESGAVIISVDGEQAISFPAQALREILTDSVLFQQLTDSNVPAHWDVPSLSVRQGQDEEVKLESVGASSFLCIETSAVDAPMHAELAAALAPAAFTNWVQPTLFALAEGEQALTVIAPNEVAADWLEHDYAPLIAQACERVVGQSLPLRFVVRQLHGGNGGAGDKAGARAAPEPEWQALEAFTLTDYAQFLRRTLVEQGIEDRVRRAVPADLIWAQAARMFVPPGTFLEALQARKGRFKDWGFLRYVVDDAVNMNVVAAKQGARSSPL